MKSKTTRKVKGWVVAGEDGHIRHKLAVNPPTTPFSIWEKEHEAAEHAKKFEDPTVTFAPCTITYQIPNKKNRKTI